MNEIELINAKINAEYIIKDFRVENTDVVLLLNNLGIKRQEKVILRNSNYCKNSYLISVSGINFALDKRICEGIIVE
jgi:Fe2+ transport system protein FeoA